MATKTVSILQAGTNSHTESAENVGAIATDFLSDGVVGSITSTSGVAPTTGAFAANAQGTPDMTVAVTGGIAWVTGTPTAGNSQRFRVNMTSSENVTISANSTGGTRYDYIYIKLDAAKLANPNLAATDVATLVVSRSTSSTTDDGTPPTYGYNIARVTVANGASSITNANITDNRAQSSVNSVLNDGWTPAAGTWTYASATTITVPSGATSKYSVGDKVKLTQSGSVKYFYIVTVASTLLTVTGGSDYTVANTTISNPYTSKAETPLGHPCRFNWTTSWTNLTVGNAVDTSTFSMNGKDVTPSVRLVLGNTSSVGTTPRLVLPVPTAATGYNDDTILSIGTLTDSGSAYYKGHLQWVSTTTADLYTEGSGGAYVNTNTVSASIPFSWSGAANDRIALNIGSYKAA